jgi:hypothetical protein
MADFKECHACMKLCFTLGQNAMENFKAPERSFREQIMGRTYVLSDFPSSKDENKCMHRLFIV